MAQGLAIKHLSLHDFRNYSDLEVPIDDNLTIFVGPNAVGKTNVIEAIQLLTSGESFRRPSWNEVVREGADSSRIALHAEGGGRRIDIQMDIKGGQRIYSLNGKTKRSPSDIRGILPSVIFTPDDLRLVKDSAEKRRATIDAFGDQIARAYEAIRGDYEKVLKHRNVLLKNPSLPVDLLDTWSEKLIEVGTAFYEHRKNLFDRLVPHIKRLYSILSVGEEIEVTYLPSWNEYGGSPPEAFREALDAVMLQERARGVTLIGPQRDEIVFSIDHRNARTFGSQGQQRTIALAWKLAEIECVEEIMGIKPLLLLDDVMSEIDATRREALTAFIGTNVQTFVTAVNTDGFRQESLDIAKVVSFRGR